MPRLTHVQYAAISLAKDDAASAEMTLRRRARSGPKARPHVSEINSTLDRLVSIQRLLNIALEPNNETKQYPQGHSDDSPARPLNSPARSGDAA